MTIHINYRYIFLINVQSCTPEQKLNILSFVEQHHQKSVPWPTKRDVWLTCDLNNNNVMEHCLFLNLVNSSIIESLLYFCREWTGLLIIDELFEMLSHRFEASKSKSIICCATSYVTAFAEIHPFF